MSYKAIISIYALVCTGLGLPSTEGSLIMHPYYRDYRFHHSYWPDLDLFDEPFSNDPFFRDLFEWDPFKDTFFDFPIHRKPAIGNQKSCLSKPASQKAPSVKPSTEGLKFRLKIEGFEPRELTLMTKGNDVIVKGEKNNCDSTSYFARTLCWRKKLPQDTEMETIRAKITSDKVVEITAEKKKEIEGESNTNEIQSEFEFEEKLSKPQNDIETDKQVRRFSPGDLPMNSDNLIKGAAKPVTRKEGASKDDDEETTLEVVNDDDQH